MKTWGSAAPVRNSSVFMNTNPLRRKDKPKMHAVQSNMGISVQYIKVPGNHAGSLAYALVSTAGRVGSGPLRVFCLWKRSLIGRAPYSTCLWCWAMQDCQRGTQQYPMATEPPQGLGQGCCWQKHLGTWQYCELFQICSSQPIFSFAVRGLNDVFVGYCDVHSNVASVRAFSHLVVSVGFWKHV